MDFKERLLANFAYLDHVYVGDAAGVGNLGANAQRFFIDGNVSEAMARRATMKRCPLFPRTSVLARSGIIAQ
jgi:hypothetical protein